MSVLKVLIVGTGNIAKVHAEALLANPCAKMVAVFDNNKVLAEQFARQFKIPKVCADIDEALALDFDVVHVLTPPNVHYASALPFLRLGRKVVIEKPVGVSTEECTQMQAIANAAGTLTAVNQNFMYSPAYLKLKRDIADGKLGPVRFVDYVYEAPLKQLAARQFGHWMFCQPVNILLEQAVHPLSQIVDFAGRVEKCDAQAAPGTEISPGVVLYTQLQATLQCQQAPVNFRFHVGSKFPACRMTVYCDDGIAIADMFTNQYFQVKRTTYLDAADGFLSAAKSAGQLFATGAGNLLDYALAMVKLKSRSDPFYLGMKGSIDEIYAAFSAGRSPKADFAYGTHLVSVCEQMANAFPALPVQVSPPPQQVDVTKPKVLVIGGTGFIGRHTVSRLLAEQYQVRVFARGIRNLHPCFYQPGVELVSGDVRNAEHLANAMVGVQWVVNLAHGGGGANFEEIRKAMVDSAIAVCDAAIAAKIQRLVHVGSISSLFLGDMNDVITGATPSDPKSTERNDYSRAKALADQAVVDVCSRNSLDLVILRPGLVVGEGTSPFHGGLGFFNNEQYCNGWNLGKNPLPWVLVADCADAVCQALTSSKAVNRSYNLVGDVRWSAREYLAELSLATGRPLRFKATFPQTLWAVEVVKWLIKTVGGKKSPFPPLRDIQSRGLVARFDCSDAKEDLHWQPVADANEFKRQAISIFGSKTE